MYADIGGTSGYDPTCNESKQNNHISRCHHLDLTMPLPLQPKIPKNMLTKYSLLDLYAITHILINETTRPTLDLMLISDLRAD